MMIDRSTESAPKPDYPKIIFVAVPLCFVVWCFLLIGLAFLSHDITISFYGSLVLTLLFAVAYFYVTVKRMNWFKTGEKGTEAIGPDSRSRRTVSTREAIKAGILVLFLLCAVVFSELVLQIPGQKALRLLVPIFAIVGVVERYMRRRRTKRDNRAKVDETTEHWRPIEP